ncbi:hypothetical protein B0H11DRAFT_1999860 [Mycena galericulata]|nr:hypothetical protein B0H11DRAFT_1999860 [Mycena galericulata]
MNTLLPYVFLALFATVRAAPLQKRGSISTCTDLIFSGVGDPSLQATCLNDSLGIVFRILRSTHASATILETSACKHCTLHQPLRPVESLPCSSGKYFRQTCSQIALNGLELSAECDALDFGISVVGSEVNLDTVITIVNGVLTCSG